MEGKPFAKRLTCPSCGETRALLRLECSLSEKQRRCGNCGQRMITTGFDLLERLGPETVLKDARSCSFRGLGLRSGEVFSVGEGVDESHYEIS